MKRNNTRRNCLRRREGRRKQEVLAMWSQKSATLFVRRAEFFLPHILPAPRKFHFMEKQPFRESRVALILVGLSRLSFAGLSYRAAVLEIIELDMTAAAAVAFNPTWNFHVSCVLALRVIFNLLVTFPSLHLKKGKKYGALREIHSWILIEI